MTLNEFVDMYNYEMVQKYTEKEVDGKKTKEPVELPEEVLEALKELVGKLFLKHVDDLEEVPEFKFIDKAGSIELI
jgi:dihydroneopterin aldolase